MTERSLADEAEVEQEQTVTPDPASFDVIEWAAGVRPQRVSVPVRHNLHLYPQLQDVARRINAADEDADVDDLVDEFEALKAQMLTTFVLERRSSEWVAEFTREATKALVGPKRKGGKAKPLTSAQAQTLAIRLIHAQIVAPEGVTVEALEALLATDPRAVDALAEALASLNVGEADLLDEDFGSRRSGRR